MMPTPRRSPRRVGLRWAVAAAAAFGFGSVIWMGLSPCAPGDDSCAWRGLGVAFALPWIFGLTWILVGVGVSVARYFKPTPVDGALPPTRSAQRVEAGAATTRWLEECIGKFADVPSPGLDLRAHPDPAIPPMARFNRREIVRVLAVDGTWARVSSHLDATKVGWVDGTKLRPRRVA